MTNTSENNKRIAKNTLFLYFRMILVMGVSLYTSRVILESLGVSGFGLYSVIGGIVILFSIFSGSLSSAISRFLTYELGTGNIERLKAIFASAICIQLILCVIIIIVLTPISIWFIDAKMNIPNGDYVTAYWVLGFSIATFCISLLSVPFNSSIISHEDMAIFSYVSILEVCLKLVIAYLVTAFNKDRVIIYSAMLLGVSLVVQAIYMIYCRRKFEECQIIFQLEKGIFKEIGIFAGWNFIGSAADILRNQGNNLILNIFYGTVVNAAYAIAMQVNNAVNQLANNFMVSVNPQITKYYATGEFVEMHKLIFRSSKLSFFLTWILAILIIVNTPYILGIWLVDVPGETVTFVRLIMIWAVSESISKPLVTAMLATGKIRNYQLVVGGLLMMNVPVSYVVLKCGGNAFWPLVISVIISQLCFAARLIMLRPLISLKVRAFIKQVFSRIINIIFITLLLPLFVTYLNLEPTSFSIFTLQCIVYASWTSLVIFIFGMTKNERSFIKDKAKVIIKKIKF